jgi:hypothetical protein
MTTWACAVRQHVAPPDAGAGLSSTFSIHADLPRLCAPTPAEWRRALLDADPAGAGCWSILAGARRWVSRMGYLGFHTAVELIAMTMAWCASACCG